MKLHVLMYGRTKNKMQPIMIDSYKKCDNYMKARKNVAGFHEIIEAPDDAKTWRQKTSTVGGNKYQAGRNNGYISKNGFNPHT